jgi:hypothetical protein
MVQLCRAALARSTLIAEAHSNQAAHRRFHDKARAQIVANRKRMVPIALDEPMDIPGFGRRAYSLHLE